MGGFMWFEMLFSFSLSAKCRERGRKHIKASWRTRSRTCTHSNTRNYVHAHAHACMHLLIYTYMLTFFACACLDACMYTSMTLCKKQCKLSCVRGFIPPPTRCWLLICHRTFPRATINTTYPSSATHSQLPTATIGQSKFAYYGRHSEGNRFIRNGDL